MTAECKETVFRGGSQSEFGTGRNFQRAEMRSTQEIEFCSCPVTRAKLSCAFGAQDPHPELKLTHMDPDRVPCEVTSEFSLLLSGGLCSLDLLFRLRRISTHSRYAIGTSHGLRGSLLQPVIAQDHRAPHGADQ